MILFIFAHPDDEAFGPAGTIKLMSEDNDVVVASLCRGNRPGNEHVSGPRQLAFKKSCDVLGAQSVIGEFSDLKLEYHSTLKFVEDLIDEYKPTQVFTHSPTDIHKDHRLLAECVTVVCRPKPNSSVDELYYCETQPSTDWAFGNYGVFMPNVYVDVSKYMIHKEKVVDLYNTETYGFPDPRSHHGVEAHAKYRGKQVSMAAAEAFQLVFSRRRRSEETHTS